MISEQILSSLPANARDKLEQFVDDKDAAYAVYRAASDKSNAARSDLVYHQTIANRQLTGGGGVEVSHPGHYLVNKEKIKNEEEELNNRIMEPVKNAKQRLQRAEANRESAEKAMAQFAFVDEVIAWLERNVKFGEYFTPAPFEAPKSGNIISDLSKVRDRLKLLDDQWSKVESAPLSADELQERVFAEIDTIAERGAFSISATNRNDEPLGLRQRIALGTRPGRDGATFIVGDAGAPLFIWLVQEELKKKVSGLISGLNIKNALSDEDQEKAFSRISAERLDLERHEEALICLAIDKGLSVERRRYADPRAILGIHA